MSFVHLQIKSTYSLLQSTITINQLIQQAKDQGYFALALTDRNTMYATIHFYEQCLKHEIKPIIGLTADIWNEETATSYPLVILAENEKGYANLLKISSAIMTKSLQGLPMKWLKAYSEGLIAITPGLEGEIEQLLLENKEEEAIEKIKEFKSIFKETNFYFSLQNHLLQEEDQINEKLLQLSKEFEVPIVATNNVHYLTKEDALVQKCLVAIDKNKKLNDLTEMFKTDEYYFKTKQEMIENYSFCNEAIENTIQIANRCNVFIPLNKQHLPNYPVPTKQNAKQYLEEICTKGLYERFKNPTTEYKERLAYELAIINKMNFADYFLIVWDFISYARNKGILIGPGRGSAAGSLVSYCLKITDVDPIAHHLLFERFLNPERISMPDIDIDFPDNKRDEIISYVTTKYGELNVAQIITFGTFAKKQAVRDIGRILGLTTSELENFSKHISEHISENLVETYNKSINFQRFVDQSVKYKQVYELACKIEGLPRHHSTHAAGVVISSEPLVQFIPIQQSSNSIYLTQLEMNDLEKIGLLKMDFLGLRNLTLIDTILKMIRINTKKQLTLQDIPLEDDQTFQLLQSGETTGIFQLESQSAKMILMKLKPTSFSDIVAVNALNRPGPMDNVEEFIQRKHHKVSFNYPHKSLEPILKDTYGIIVYQEQIMQIASVMAGFSLGQADLLRRAISKKNREIMMELKKSFVNGCLENGYSLAVANEVYDLIVRFANYGFNRSHAVAYSFISYQLAYLKAHYKAEFMASLLSGVSGNSEKVAQYVRECKKMNMDVLPPCIVKSNPFFTVENDCIRFSLSAIKGVGFVALQEILQKRKEKPFIHFTDFCYRVLSKAVNRKTIEALIHAGCFDLWQVNRATLLATLDTIIDHINLFPKELGSLFEEEDRLPTIRFTEVEDWDLGLKMEKEKEVLGFYLSLHPVKEFSSYMKPLRATYLANVVSSNLTINAIVYLTDIRKIKTKKNDTMAFIKFSDETKEMDGVIFPNEYAKLFAILEPEKVYFISGKLEKRNEQNQLIVNNLIPINLAYSMYEQKPDSLYLRINEQNHYSEKMIELKNLLKKYPGPMQVKIYYENQHKLENLNKHYSVANNKEFILQLEQFLGKENVIVTK